MHECYKIQGLYSVPSKVSYIYILKTGSQSAEILKIVLKMAKKELNLIWGEKKSLMVWLNTSNAILPESWLLKLIHALEEGKAEHPLTVTLWVPPHTPVSHQRFAVLWAPSTRCSCRLSGQTVFLLHAHKIKPVKTGLFWPSVFEYFWISKFKSAPV